MEGRVKVHPRPFSRSSRSAELAAAVSAPPTKPGVLGSRPSASVSSSTTSAERPVTVNRPSASSTSNSTTSSSNATAVVLPPPVVAQEYCVRVPKTNLKPISIMRFNGALGVDPSKWSGLKMAREDNSRLHKVSLVHDQDDNMPKFGAGSEYGREAREEARRKKYGSRQSKKYNAEEQPWIMKASDKNSRKYRGVKEGGVSENASYYIFTQAADGGFEVFPVNHWYNFTPIQRYKSLTAEEAEEQFGRRNKIYNYFSVMVRKRLKADDDNDPEAEEMAKGKQGKKKASSGLKVSEMEDWDESENEESEDADSDKDEKGSKKPKKKGVKGKGKKKKKGSDEEAEEDSDDGDGEGRELDYISDTSETESEEEKEKKNAEIGVDQEAGLKNLLDSDSDEEETPAKDDALDDEEEEEGADKKADANGKKAEDTKESKKKQKKKTKASKGETNAQENLSDEDDDDDKIADELDSALESAKLEAGGGSNSRDGTSDVLEALSGSKRKASSDLLGGLTNASKKTKMEVSPALVQSAAAEGITEEAVRRYLLRKPMTVTELLQKFKSKKTKMQSQDMVNVIAHILKKINPVKRTQNQKMYLYLSNKT